MGRIRGFAVLPCKKSCLPDYLMVDDAIASWRKGLNVAEWQVFSVGVRLPVSQLTGTLAHRKSN
jgi:hypothetical protein